MHDKIEKIAGRAAKLLNKLSETINEDKKEFDSETYSPTFSKAALADFPELAKAKVDKAVSELETAGYTFKKRKAGKTEVYDMDINDVIKIYEHRGVPKYRDNHSEALVLFLNNLKGGVAKTVSAVTLAHGFRCTPQLIQHDLRVLVIDLDPQASATMFLNHNFSIGSVDTTSAQAMLQNVTREELIDEFIQKTNIDGVDVIPASIEDAFIASQFESLSEEYLPEQKIYNILKENIIDKIKGDYDFILLDSGPHLDAFLLNSFVAADALLIPVPPAQVDFHSSLKFLARIPGLFEKINDSGSKIDISTFAGFMTKTEKNAAHQNARSILKDVCGAEIIDVALPLSKAFERSGESFSTVFSTNPKYYAGDKKSLQAAREKAEEFTISVFDKLNLDRSN